MNKYTIESRYNKQIEECEKFIRVLETALGIIEKFEGKVINVKIEKALEEALSTEELQIKVSHFSTDLTITDYKNDRFRIYYDDRTISKYACGRIDHTSMNINLAETGDRVDMDVVKKGIEHQININKKLIEICKNRIEQYDSITKDYEDLRQMIRNFREKYDSVYVNDCGYSLNNIY